MQRGSRNDDPAFSRGSSWWTDRNDSSWREAYESRSYAGSHSYEQLRPAYLLGWQSRARFGERRWEEIEEELAREWEIARLSGGLRWEEVRAAVRDAWSRAVAEADKEGRGASGQTGYGRGAWGSASEEGSYSGGTGASRGFGWGQRESGSTEHGYGTGRVGEGYGSGGYSGSRWSAGRDYERREVGSRERDYGSYGTDSERQSRFSSGWGARDYGAEESSWERGGYGYGSSSGYSGDWGGQADVGPYSGRGPRGYERSNERIREDVGELLTRHGQVDATDIEVRVENSEVFLEGSVRSRLEKRVAEQAVETVSGVRDVHNRLRVQGFGVAATPSGGGSGWTEGRAERSLGWESASREQRTEPTSAPPRPPAPPGGGPPPPALSEMRHEPGPSSPVYALIDCPEVVVAEVEFALAVGISPQPMVEAEMPLDVPEATEYVLVVHVIAEGFRLRQGESERNQLRVTRENPYPVVVLHLTPEPQDVPVRLRRIRANYSNSGQAIGFAVRSIAVVESHEFAASEISIPRPLPSTVHPPTAETAPDLTINVQLGDSAGTLLWSLESPHQIEIPDRRLESNIGREPDRFARHYMNLINAREGTTGLYTFLIGIGREIAEKVPGRIWKALRAVAAECGGVPDVLILSQEPYVPWELAVMPKPLLDPQTPPFFAAQANVGRWAIRKDYEDGEGSTERPKPIPPTGLEVEAMAVVWGVYEGGGKWKRLEEAEKEAAELTKLYPAEDVNADFTKVSCCLKGTPEADLLHFAVHGVYSPESLENGLMLVDKRTLHPFDIKGVDLKRPVFVFLNACQVGNGDQILGDYAGIAEAFLYAGASGVIAPLWSVKDKIARQVALDFYSGIIKGRSPASIVRGERARFKDSEETVSATYLAYQFFGHPQLKLTGLHPRKGGES